MMADSMAGQMATSHRMWNTVRVPASRMGADFQSGVEYIWQDDAACAFQPPTMFEIAHPYSPIAEGLGVQELRDLNDANFEAAKKVCDGCPVLDQCLSSAEPGDFQETFRAGLIPTNYPKKPWGRPKGAAKAVRNDPTKPCKNNHPLDSWRNRKDRDAWYCKDCVNLSKGAGNGRIKNDPTQPCRNNHELRHWAPRGKTNGWYCKQCVRDNKGYTERVQEEECPQGHKEWAYRESGKRWCKACNREASKASHHAKAAKRAAKLSS